MPIGNAKFGSGLLSVTFGRPSMTEILVRVIIGRCDHRSYNAYYETSLSESDMTLAKDTNVNIRVQCSDLSYDSGADDRASGGDLPLSYTRIADLNNDPVVYDDDEDLSTIRGDSVRYFLITGAEAGQTPQVTITTDAVTDSTGGRLQSITLTAQTLPRRELRGGTLSCFKHSYYDDGEALSLANGGSLASVWHGWDQGTSEAKHTYGTPTVWTITGSDASGNITYSGTGDPANGDLVCISNTSVENTFGYVSAIDTGTKTFVALDHTGAAIDFVADGWTNNTLTSVGDEPPAGMSGLHFERIGAQNPHFYAVLDDSVYSSRLQANNHLPIINTAHSRGAWTRRIQNQLDTLESSTVNRDTGTPQTLAFAQNARFFFIQPEIIEAGQKAPLVFIRGDWDLTPGNDFSHLPLAANSVAWATFGGDATDTSNPLLDANWSARMTNTVTAWASGTDLWNVYFAGGNPTSFVQDQADTDYPPVLEVDSSGNYTVNPVTQYGAQKRHYMNRAFTIENERHCLVCPDSMSHRGARLSGAWDAHPFFSQAYPKASTVIVGQEWVWGPYQEAQIQLKVNSVKDRKKIGLLNKGMILLGSYDISEINPDSAYSSARDESARVSTYFQTVGALMQVGDRHVTPTERAAGKARAVEGSFIQQCVAGAHQAAYGASTSSHDLSFGLVNGSNNVLTLQTKLVTNETLHNDSLEVSGVAQTEIEFVTGQNSSGNRSGGGLGGTSRCGGNINCFLENSDGEQVLQIRGISNVFSGPAGNRGARLLCAIGVGDVTSGGTPTDGTELPDGLSITLGGFTFTKALVDQIGIFTLGSIQFKEFFIRGSYWGNASDALDPTTADWAASTSYSVDDRVHSQDANIDLVCTVAGTSGTTPPVIDGAFGTTLTDNTVTWEQDLPTDTHSASVSWTDSSAASGGSNLEGLIDQNLLTDDSRLLRA